MKTIIQKNQNGTIHRKTKFLNHNLPKLTCKFPVDAECGIFEGGVTVLPEAYAMEGRPVKPNPNVMVEGDPSRGNEGRKAPLFLQPAPESPQRPSS